jgi:single-strand DNA-binding protein
MEHTQNNPNEVYIVGSLLRDAEVKKTNKGCPLCQFVLSYAYRWKGKVRTFFFDVVQFGQEAAEGAVQLKKGVDVEVWGRLEQSVWKDKEGQVRNRTKIVATRIEVRDVRV